MWPLTIACGRCQAWVWPWRTGVPGLPPPRVRRRLPSLALFAFAAELRGVNTADRPYKVDRAEVPIAYVVR